MPRQNRVNPFGHLVATPQRGTFLGNRGLLHDDQGCIKRPWQVKRWIVCLLRFKGRNRQVMTPGLYTELFFLDEATALAAGHRPCAECRRERFNAFRTAWLAGTPDVGSLSTAPEMDARLHFERIDPERRKRTFAASLREMPNGVFVTLAAWPEQACLVWGNDLLPWSPGGYGERLPRPDAEATVLTPASTVAALRAGYVPEVHVSAKAEAQEDF